MSALTMEHTLWTKGERVYRQAANRWTGCDWPTAIGLRRLDLNGLRAEQAILLARATSGGERADWQAAVDWLSRVEQDARAAQAMAHKALELARTGQLVSALFHIDGACTIESKYHNRLVWEPLREVLESALRSVAD